jgi:hypothetical protein
MTRIVRSALHNAEETWFSVLAARISPAITARVVALADVGEGDSDDEGAEDLDSVLALVKAVPGNVSLESMLTEIRKLTAIRAVGLPPGMFADVAPKVVSGWRARAVESPSPDRPAGRAGVPVDQHRAPAGHRRPGADRPVRAGREPDLLPGRGDRPAAPRHDR